MSDPTKAVFLSYAREDTGAAKRIAEALRGFGVEVWFDQAELRGGDAWDTKIRTQIKTCALFLPIVSVQTQERTEGYFRREWKLAVDRTQDMGSGRTFIVPVVIDDTKESGADVPEEFMRYQWTRLAHGVPTPQFVEQVKRLLDAPKKSATPASDVGRDRRIPLSASVAPSEPAGSGDPALQPTRRNAPLPFILGAIAVLVIGVAIFSFLRPAAKDAALPPVPVVATKPAPTLAAEPQVYNKSIAVLPFENRSDDKANAYFTDGIHEDILTNLAHIAELRVVSRTSVMEYRGTTKKIRQIGQELGVAWLLEGSVQRAGSKVRVTGQLINARTDEHVWAQSYDRDLTDVFAIQADLAKEIAGALSATLSPQEKTSLERRPTTNSEAYELVLKVREMDRIGNDTRAEQLAEIALLERALALDPSYAEAWGALSSTLAQIRFAYRDITDATLARARAAVERAQALAPGNVETFLATGQFYYYALRDYPRALEQFEQVVQRLPNYYFGPFMVGLVQRRQGKHTEALANLRRAQQLDPASLDLARNLVLSLRALRRYDEAMVEQERRVRLLPESLVESFNLAQLRFFATGATKDTDELLVSPLAERADPKVRLGFRAQWAATKGDLATVTQLTREHPELIDNPGAAWGIATVLAAQGDLAAARASVEKFPAQLRARLDAEPNNPPLWGQLALIESMLGHRDDALAAAQKAVALMPESLDALASRGPRFNLAIVLAWNGDKAAACAELERVFATSGDTNGQINTHVLKKSPAFAPLRGDPHFEALLADPKNNAPLF